MNLTLEPVVPTPRQIKILYSQLQSRAYNISHNKTPSIEEHRNFVKKNPYRSWFIIREKDNLIGNIYVQFDNSIGLNCKEEIEEKYLCKILCLLFKQLDPLEAIPSVRSAKFFFNVPSSNIIFQNKLNYLGFKEVQRTFVLVDKKRFI